MKRWEECIEWVLNWEKYITIKNNKKQAIWGIDKDHWKDEFDKMLPMSEQDARSYAKQFYLVQFWNVLKCDDLPEPMDIYVMDAGVNLGVSVARNILKDNATPEQYIIARIFRYMQLALKNEKFRQYFLGWVRRSLTLYYKFPPKKEEKEEEKPETLSWWSKLKFILQLLKVKKKISARSVSSMKSGVKTSEFWQGLMVALLVYLNNYFDLGIDKTTIAYLVGIAITYILGRSYVKAKNGG